MDRSHDYKSMVNEKRVWSMKWLPAALTTLLLSLSASILHAAQVLTIYSDAGMTTDQTFVDSFPSGQVFANGNFTGASVTPEGFTVWKTTYPSSSGNSCWIIAHYNTAQNLSTYAGGKLHFWLNSANGNITIKIQDSGGERPLSLVSAGWQASYANKWHLYEIPLSSFSGLTLSSIVNPFIIVGEVNGGTFYFDDVKWITSDISGNFISVTPKRRTDNVQVSSLTWNSLSLPTKGVLADQYLEVLVSASTTSWGAQIYTDNTGSGASPAYAGAGNASGLVDVTSPTKTVPLLWTILDTVDVSTAPGNPIFNPGTAEFNAPFFYIKDLAGSAPLTNMEDYITTMNNTGIHYSPGSTNYGATRTPDYIFIAADFTNAVTPRTYKTNRLTLEFFTP